MSTLWSGLEVVATAIVVYVLLAVGAGTSGLILNFGLGFPLHTSDAVGRVFIDAAGLGVLLGFVPTALLTAFVWIRAVGWM